MIFLPRPAAAGSARAAVLAAALLATLGATAAPAGAVTSTTSGTADTMAMTTTVQAASVPPCHAEGVPGGLTRDAILDRAWFWLGRNQAYDMERCAPVSDDDPDEYRTDCSGYVSLAWGLSQSYGTGSFKDDTSLWKTIAWSDLQPGDAIVRPKPATEPTGHIVLFHHWTDSTHTKLVSWEESGQKLDAEEMVRAVTTLKSDNYHPIRYQKIHEVASFGEGSYVQVSGQPVYRIVGGAPVYVSSWTAVGGQKPVVTITADTFNGLPRYPRNGTFVRDYSDKRVYRIAGTAPLYISTWDGFTERPADSAILDIDHSALTNAGKTGVWNHLHKLPTDGTFLRDNRDGRTYVTAGGAPQYLYDWANIGATTPRATTTVSGPTLDRAGTAAPYDNLRATPTDHTFIRTVRDANGTTATRYYRMAGGAPVYVSSWTPFGGAAQPAVTIDARTLDAAGTTGSHLRATPADGTWITGGTRGQVFRVEGGAPQYVQDWAGVGISDPTTVTVITVDDTAIDRAGDPAPWHHLRLYPLDGTRLTAGPGGTRYTTTGGRAIRYTGTTTFPTTSVIHPAVLTHLGGTTPWNHLLP